MSLLEILGVEERTLVGELAKLEGLEKKLLCVPMQVNFTISISDNPRIEKGLSS